MLQWNERVVAVDDLKPFERNPRKISAKQLAKLKASLAENGYHQRIIATHDLRIIGGHQRIRVLKDLGITEIAVLVPDQEISAQQFRQLLIQDNLPFGEFDHEMLAADFSIPELEAWGVPEDWLKRMPKEIKVGLVDEEDVPDLQAHPVTLPGDTWVLGNHKIRCGSSTVATDVETLLGNVQPHLMVTDAPYGVEYDAKWRDDAMGGKEGGPATGVVKNDARADWSEAWALFPGHIAYVWHAGIYSPMVADSLTACGFKLRAQLIWAKSHFAISRSDYHWQHEPCWYAVKDKGYWKGDRKQSTLWQIDKPQKSETGHSTQKPVECMRRPIENNSSPGQAVYEPFSGSGTTIIAAEQTGRHCYAMELSPAYVDVAVKRWQNFTGQQATLWGNGRTFAEIAAGRGGES